VNLELGDWSVVARWRALRSGSRLAASVFGPHEPAHCCTDACGNYVGDWPDPAVDDYVGAESSPGHVLCPSGGPNAISRVRSPDPASIARMIYFGTSDENLYAETATAASVRAARAPAE
jgi:hypothetical protein